MLTALTNCSLTKASGIKFLVFSFENAVTDVKMTSSRLFFDTNAAYVIGLESVLVLLKS